MTSMKSLLFKSSPVLFVTLFAARAAFPQIPNEYAKIMLHLVPYGSVGGNKCSSSKASPKCSDMKVAGKLNEPYFAYVVLTDGERDRGFSGVQFGIDYNGASRVGVDVHEWHKCGELEWPHPPGAWPGPRSGNLITFNPDSDCQREEPGGFGTGVTAVAGYFYLTAYTPDRMSVTVRPVDGLAKVADCVAFAESVVAGPGVNFTKSHLGFVEFTEDGTTPGYNPCGQAKPVRDTTWGEVKANTEGN